MVLASEKSLPVMKYVIFSLGTRDALMCLNDVTEPGISEETVHVCQKSLHLNVRCLWAIKFDVLH